MGSKFTKPMIRPGDMALPALSVEVADTGDLTYCNGVTFTVILSPGLAATSGVTVVKVRITDLSLGPGQPYAIQDVPVPVPAAGGSTTISWGPWPMPSDASFVPDFRNELRIEVDPDHEIAERNENDKSVTFVGACVG